MAIVAILFSLAFVSFQGSRKTARDGRRKADLEQIRSGLEIYRTDCQTYPAFLTFGSSLTGAEAICLNNEYLALSPEDPGSYTYVYRRVNANAYFLCAYLETGDQSLNYDDSSHCNGSCGDGIHCNYLTANP